MMKTLIDYIAEETQRAEGPVVGDILAINMQEDCLLETHVVEMAEDGIVVAADEQFLSLLETYGAVIGEESKTPSSSKIYDKCWTGYRKVPGKKRGEKGSCEKIEETQRELDLIRSRAGLAESDYADRKYRESAAAESNNNSTSYDSYGEWQQAASQAGATDFHNFADDGDLILHDPEGELYGKEVAYTDAAMKVKGAPAQTVGRWDWDTMSGEILQTEMSESDNYDDYDDYDDSEDEVNDEGFFVVIASEDDGVFLGSIIKDGGKWRESGGQGPKPSNWGSTYMSYLKPEEIMSWMRQDYGRYYEVLGPFADENEAMDRADTLREAEYQGRKVTLNKPMSNTDGKSKSKVYVKDPQTGNVKKVTFGDPDMRIRKSNPEARKSFRARHKCDNPGPKTKARYWSCRAW
jgi:hypothetical protein